MVYAFFEWLLSRGVNPKLNGVSEWGTRRDEDACAHPLCGSVWSHQSKKAHWIRTHRVFPASPINSILALRAKIYYMVQKVTIYPSYSSARTMPPGCCPCAANLIISLQFWKTYTGCLLSKESNTRCCSSLIKLCMVKPRHISPSCCLCILQPGPAIREQKSPQSAKMPFGRVW